jgi:hypothetical protein
MVSQRETDMLLYEEMTAWADNNDEGLADTPRRQDPPLTKMSRTMRRSLSATGNASTPFELPSDANQRSAQTGMMGIGATDYAWSRRTGQECQVTELSIGPLPHRR